MKYVKIAYKKDGIILKMPTNRVKNTLADIALRSLQLAFPSVRVILSTNKNFTGF